MSEDVVCCNDGGALPSPPPADSWYCEYDAGNDGGASVISELSSSGVCSVLPSPPSSNGVVLKTEGSLVRSGSEYAEKIRQSSAYGIANGLTDKKTQHRR